MVTSAGCASGRLAALQPFTPAPTRASSEPPALLSAFHGLDALPLPAQRLCDRQAVGQDGMPVVFSVPLDESTVRGDAFKVMTPAGPVTPVCATLRPAVGPWEGHTVLLAGPFGSPDQPPSAVEVVGALRTIGGASATGLRTTAITPLGAGPLVVMAEALSPAAAGLQGACPAGTLQLVQLVWQGGVTGPNGAALGPAQRAAVTLHLAGGAAIQPTALGDDDPDNYVLACTDRDEAVEAVSVAAGHFHDPGDDANPAVGPVAVRRSR
jgi:hypothetical protein